jgi:hypothetical protein
MPEEKYKPYCLDPRGFGKFLSEIVEENHGWLSDVSWDYLQEWEQLELTTIATEFVNLINYYIKEDTEYPEDLGYILYEITYPYWFDQHGSMESVWESYEEEKKESFRTLAQELLVISC